MKIRLHVLKNIHLSGPVSRKKQFGLTKSRAFFNVSILKWKYSTFLFNSLRFKIILHLLSFLGRTKIGDMYSLFEWCAFLITPFFSNSDTSKSIACICSVENLWLCSGFSLYWQFSEIYVYPSAIFRISSSIVICFHWAKQKRIQPALKSSDCFCNSSSILGTLSQKSLTSFGSAF